MITIKEVNKGYISSGYLGEINKENRARTRLSELIKCFNENNQECTDIILQNWDKSSEIYAFLRDNLYDIWGCATLDYDGVMNYARTIEDYEHEIALSFIEDLCEYCGISPDKSNQKENIEREEMITEDYENYDDIDSGDVVYEGNAYYNKRYSGLAHSEQFSNASDMYDWVWSMCQDGYYVTVYDYEDSSYSYYKWPDNAAYMDLSSVEELETDEYGNFLYIDDIGLK